MESQIETTAPAGDSSAAAEQPERQSKWARLRRWPARVHAAVLLTAYALVTGAVAPASAAGNPLDGITPDMSLLGPAFNSSWKRLGGALWGVVIGILAFKVITSTLKARRAKRNAASSDLAEATEELQESLFMLGACALASVIIAAVLFVATPQS
ncbi:hypothetical protein [Tsukamurella pulmonis]|uniref:hypothetical protein n=1 Tax=Tsukamurella pulmonis TaxID=47312 RepID=UPI001112633B|nr:hypothetical protein [Tsukamurella pulmonis]